MSYLNSILDGLKNANINIAQIGITEQLPSFVEEFKPVFTYDVIVINLDEKPSLFNKAFLNLNSNGVIIFKGGLPYIKRLIEMKEPVLIAEEDRSVSIYFPLEDKKIFIENNSLPLTRESDDWAFINWYNNYGNKNIICRNRFVFHILYNRFCPVKRFL